MAVTVNQTPGLTVLGYSPQMFLAISSQIAQPNFLYRVIVTDLLTGTVYPNQDIYKNPDGYCIFDAMPLAENLLTQYIPTNLYGWQKATGIRKIRVNIGEVYGSTPAYYAGSNYDYVIWNGIEDYLKYPGFNINEYLYSNAATNYVYLTSRFSAKAYSGKSDYFYALTKGANDLMKIRVTTYDSSGGSLGIYEIPNPYQASTTYSDKYLCIDIGVKGLTNIPALSVNVIGGSLPIITASVASYRVQETNTIASVDQPLREIKFFTIGCEPRWDIITIHFLRLNGAFETIHFNKRDNVLYTAEKTTYKKYPFSRSGSAYTYSRSTGTTQVLSSSINKRLKLNTDWLSDDQIDVFRELVSSPKIYLDEGSALNYAELSCITPQFDTHKYAKKFQLTAEFDYSHTNSAQRV